MVAIECNTTWFGAPTAYVKLELISADPISGRPARIQFEYPFLAPLGPIAAAKLGRSEGQAVYTTVVFSWPCAALQKDATIVGRDRIQPRTANFPEVRNGSDKLRQMRCSWKGRDSVRMKIRVSGTTLVEQDIFLDGLLDTPGSWYPEMQRLNTDEIGRHITDLAESRDITFWFCAPERQFIEKDRFLVLETFGP